MVATKKRKVFISCIIIILFLHLLIRFLFFPIKISGRVKELSDRSIYISKEDNELVDVVLETSRYRTRVIKKCWVYNLSKIQVGDYVVAFGSGDIKECFPPIVNNVKIIIIF